MNPLLAVILVLAILVAGSIGYFGMFSSASSGVSSQNALQSVQTIFSNVQANFAITPNNFTGFDNTAAVAAGIPPASWVPSGSVSTIADDWGGAVTFGVANINGGTSNGWTMTMEDAPSNQCATVAGFYTPQTYEILVNGTAIATNPAYGGAGTWPPAEAAIEVACDKSQNSIEFEVAGQ
jgi:hypothetical protein